MKLDKILKNLPEGVKEALDALAAVDLNAAVAAAEEAISKATRERDALSEYQAAKQAVSDLSLGLKDVKKYQAAKIHYCLRRLRELSGEDLGEE